MTEPRSAASAADLAATLAARFGRKPRDPAKLAARYPGHEDAAFDVFSRLREGEPLRFAPSDELLRIAVGLDALRRFGAGLRPEVVQPLWRDLQAAVKHQPALPDDATPLACALAAEVAWAGAILFDGGRGAAARRRTARQAVLAEFDARTDTDGTPHADLLNVLPAWFASLVRSTGWAKAAGVRLWDAAFAERFDGLIAAAAVLARGDGRPMLAGGHDLRTVLHDAVKRSTLADDDPTRRLVARLRKAGPLAIPGPSGTSRPHRSDRTTPPVVQSDWAKLACSRSRRRADADAVAVAFPSEQPALELVAFGRAVLSGPWGLTLRLDGAELPLSADWEAVSWFSDEDADYLELQWPNELGVTVCRQVLLTRGDHQLFLADAVSTPSRPDATIEIEATLAAAGVTVTERRPLRELRLDADGLPLRAFPVGLPMSRVDGAPGSFVAEEGRLVLRQAGRGGVYAPLVFDWHPRRREAFADWRRLTVTEDRRKLMSSEAVAARLRIGGRQLLIDRRLDGSKVRRTALGHHHGYESVVAAFTSAGDVEPLVLVE